MRKFGINEKVATAVMRRNMVENIRIRQSSKALLRPSGGGSEKYLKPVISILNDFKRLMLWNTVSASDAFKLLIFTQMFDLKISGIVSDIDLYHYLSVSAK